MRNTLTWSYDLLGSSDQLLFRRLAAFVHGWTLEAAELVTVDEALPASRVLDGVQLLIDSSLVHRVQLRTDESRFEMLETVHEYAVACLSNSAEQMAVQIVIFSTTCRSPSRQRRCSLEGTWRIH